MGGIRPSSLLLLFISAPAAWSADDGTLIEYRHIVATRCTSCHEAGRIEQAMIEGRNLGEVLNKMQQTGVELTSRDDSSSEFFGDHFLNRAKNRASV